MGLVSGDGEVVCDGLLEQGQRITAKFGSQFAAPTESCEEAVEGFAETLAEGERDKFLGPRDYRPEDVDVNPADDPGFNASTDVVPDEGPTEIEVSCLEGDGNSWFALRQGDGSWKLAVPFCSGR